MSVTEEDVRKLARLSRIALSDDEVTKLRGEVESILAYVDAVQKVPMPEGVAASPHLDVVNAMRADENPHEPGKYTEALLAQAPDRDGNYIRVKKVL